MIKRNKVNKVEIIEAIEIGLKALILGSLLFVILIVM
ncbi:hypothetical protein BJV85_003989 [Clostridium acetobutylicum]|nr:hypothetical protein [Clostridium acetobutylicum]NRY54928.1 hypothetical protein [Clostridium acetobutylicum]NSA95042.1 hypothetical protein [Clostridium acetobutylicum]NYC96271.1 hypothetical protein [Clostridium acetobutylicum]